VLAVAGRWQAGDCIVSTALRIRRRLPFFATTLRTAAAAAHRMHEQTATQYAAPARARRGVRRPRQHLEQRRKVDVLCETLRRGVERAESESAAAALRFAQVTPVREAGLTS
jgi:hypothetical protein